MWKSDSQYKIKNEYDIKIENWLFKYFSKSVLEKIVNNKTCQARKRRFLPY